MQIHAASSDTVAAICASYSALYSEAACNVIGLTFDPCPFDRLGVVATPERHFFAAEGDDDIAIGDIVVTSYRTSAAVCSVINEVMRILR
jgi:hypothetical protein